MSSLPRSPKPNELSAVASPETKQRVQRRAFMDWVASGALAGALAPWLAACDENRPEAAASPGPSPSGGSDPKPSVPLPASLTLDYAYYNPVALLIKDKGWFEEEFAKDKVEIRWVLSLGSNKALEFLRGGGTDFGSTAGAAALIGRANGTPIRAVYSYSKPEWTALVTRADTGIKRVEDLKGKSVAVTRGTDPHIFLLRSLDAVGLSEADIKPVLLQHPDGQRALETKQVDAWAGLDPHMAKAEIESRAVLFHRNADLNTYGVLNVREAFAKQYPHVVARVLGVYERGRKYALEHQNELRTSLVRAAKIPEAVAQKQLDERTDLKNPWLGDKHRESLSAAGKVLQKVGVLEPGLDVDKTLGELIDTSFLPRRG